MSIGSEGAEMRRMEGVTYSVSERGTVCGRLGQLPLEEALIDDV